MRAAIRRCTIATLAVVAATTASSAPSPHRGRPGPGSRCRSLRPGSHGACPTATARAGRHGTRAARPMTRATCARTPGPWTSTRAAPGRRGGDQRLRRLGPEHRGGPHPRDPRPGVPAPAPRPEAGALRRQRGGPGRRPDERTARRADRRPRLARRVARRLDGVGGGRARSAGRVLRRLPEHAGAAHGAPRRPAASRGHQPRARPVAGPAVPSLRSLGPCAHRRGARARRRAFVGDVREPGVLGRGDPPPDLRFLRRDAARRPGARAADRRAGEARGGQGGQPRPPDRQPAAVRGHQRPLFSDIVKRCAGTSRSASTSPSTASRA